MRYCGASSFYITLVAVDTVTRGPAQTFQVCADEMCLGYLNVDCSLARIKGETDDETPPLQAKSSVLYIAFRGLAIDESVEQKVVIKSLFNELTGSLALQGILLKDETPMNLEEYFKLF
ncbi:UPF0725 protein [Raphanus sativus]|nr:UPF0725 protein [Raphanus sativus]